MATKSATTGETDDTDVMVDAPYRILFTGILCERQKTCVKQLHSVSVFYYKLIPAETDLKKFLAMLREVHLPLMFRVAEDGKHCELARLSKKFSEAARQLDIQIPNATEPLYLFDLESATAVVPDVSRDLRVIAHSIRIGKKCLRAVQLDKD